MEVDPEIRERALDVTSSNFLDEADEEQYARELEDGTRQFLCLKWVADGAKTISEVVDRLADFSAELSSLDEQGYVLENPVDGGHMHLAKEPKR